MLKLMGEIPIGLGLFFGGIGQLNCICVSKFKVGALSFQVYDCVKSDNVFFPRYFQYFFVSRMFFMFFSYHRQTWWPTLR